MFTKILSKSFPLAIVLAFSVLTGCSSWKVVKKAKPNPFLKSLRYFVSQYTVQDLQVGKVSEEDFLKSKNAKEQAKWKADTYTFSRDFQRAAKTHSAPLKMVAGRPNPKTFVMSPNLYWIEPGSASKATKLKVRIRYQKRNKTYDLITMEIKVPAKTGSFSKHLRYAAKELGKRAAKYLLKRAK